MPVMQALLEQGNELATVATSASKTGLAGGSASSADPYVNSEWDIVMEGSHISQSLQASQYTTIQSITGVMQGVTNCHFHLSWHSGARYATQPRALGQETQHVGLGFRRTRQCVCTVQAYSLAQRRK